uniref:SFRICE_019008 n=1 Tax=Spodoptera frugiperda TaxID=7108 RepID=A0A2H1W040_SPOFR
MTASLAEWLQVRLPGKRSRITSSSSSDYNTFPCLVAYLLNVSRVQIEPLHGAGKSRQFHGVSQGHSNRMSVIFGSSRRPVIEDQRRVTNYVLREMREGSGSSKNVGACRVAGTDSVPVKVEVSVDVNPWTNGTERILISGTSFTPESVLKFDKWVLLVNCTSKISDQNSEDKIIIKYTYTVESEFVSIRVGYGQEDPVEVIQQVAFGQILNQFMDSPGNCRGSDPFPGVNASINEDDGFALIFEVCFGDLQVLDGTAFEGVSSVHNSSHVRILSANAV